MDAFGSDLRGEECVWAGRRGPLHIWVGGGPSQSIWPVWSPGGGAQLSAWARTCEYPEGSSPEVRGSGSCQTWATGTRGYRGQGCVHICDWTEEMAF